MNGQRFHKRIEMKTEQYERSLEGVMAAGQDSIPRIALLLEKQDKGSRIRLGHLYFAKPTLVAKNRYFTFTFTKRQNLKTTL